MSARAVDFENQPQALENMVNDESLLFNESTYHCQNVRFYLRVPRRLDGHSYLSLTGAYEGPRGQRVFRERLFAS